MKFLKMALCASMMLTVVSAPVNLSLSQAHAADALTYVGFDQFNKNVLESYELLDNYKYEKAYTSALVAKTVYKAFLSAAGKNPNEYPPAEVWKNNKAMQVTLITLLVEIGHQSHDAKKYDLALEAYELAEEVNPHLALVAYEKGFTYFTMGKQWDATKSLYEAMRLNLYPSKRKIINPFDQDFRIEPNPQSIKSRSEGILRDMGKPLNYPLNINLSTGKKMTKALVPGIGINTVDKSKKPVNIYLNDDSSKLIDSFGYPDEGDMQNYEDEFGNSKTVMFYDQGGFAYTLNDSDRRIVFIQASRPGYRVSFENIDIAIGDSAKKILSQLGRSHGFDKIPMNQGGYKETLKYNEYGLSFGTTPDDKIKSISVWTLE